MENQSKLTGFKITRQEFENNYSIIEGPGVVQGIKASGGNGKWEDPNCSWDDYKHTWLIGLKAVKAENVNEVLALFEGRNEIDAGELRIELPNGKHRNLLYTHRVIVNEGNQEPQLPFVNQEVTLCFFEKADAQGTVYLNSKGMKLAEPKTVKKFSFKKLEENVEERVSLEFGQKENV